MIELHWNGARPIPPVSIAAKPLTFRAGETFHPIWLHTNASECALATDAALTLDGIDFLFKPGAAAQTQGRRLRRPDERSVTQLPGWRSGSSGGALIAVTNGPLKASHCLFRLRGPGNVQTRLACVVVENTASCEFISTALDATPGQAIMWRPKAGASRNSTAGLADDAASPSLTNCAVDGAPAVLMDIGASSRSDVLIFRSTFLGPCALFFPSTASTGAVTIVAQNNLFDTATILGDQRRIPSATAAIRWQERENLFDPSIAYIDVPTHPRGPLVARSLAEWNTWWGQTNQALPPGQCRVCYWSRSARSEQRL